MFRASDIFGRAAGAAPAQVDSSVAPGFAASASSAAPGGLVWPGLQDVSNTCGGTPQACFAPPPFCNGPVQPSAGMDGAAVSSNSGARGGSCHQLPSTLPFDSGLVAAAPAGDAVVTSNLASGGSSSTSSCPPLAFEAADTFLGARRDRVFKLGHLGLGYYVDVAVHLTEGVRQGLPEAWRDSFLREERLVVDPSTGAGLTLERCDFGFLVEAVAAAPGQSIVAGEVVVAVEGRLLAGLSGPQMQASFLKRRADGARLTVASLAEVQRNSLRDPAIVENWDANFQRHWFFDKRTGKSSWVYEELVEAAKHAVAESAPSTQAPVDLASFLSHGFVKQPSAEPAKKKKRKVVDANAGKDESDLSRDERARWSEWNEGERGGYTEQFLHKYRNCTSFPAKEKHKDKRLKGSVGPGQGMEYMAKWTGSKNSHG